MIARYRILAVDDSADTLELIRLALSDDYDVLTLSNPLEIYECIDLFEPDLLILDIMMPKITGFQLLEILKKNPKTRDLPIIVLSAKDNIREIKHGYKLGAALYLTKPFQPDRLLKNTEAQFRMHPTEPKRKALTVDQVRIQVEVMQSGKTGQISLSSSLLTHENIARRRKDAEDFPRESSAAGPPAEADKKLEPPTGPRWEG